MTTKLQLFLPHFVTLREYVHASNQTSFIESLMLFSCILMISDDLRKLYDSKDDELRTSTPFPSPACSDPASAASAAAARPQ